MLARVLKTAGIGFLIGIIIGNLVAALTGSASDGEIRLFSGQLLKIAGDNEILAMIMQSLFSGLYGALCFGGMIFYDVERIPLAAATASHAAIIVLSFIPISLLLGWVETIAQVLVIAAVQIVVFFMIWLFMFAIYRKQVRELNELTKKKHSETKSEEK